MTSSNLDDMSQKKCKPCEGGVEPLSLEQVQASLAHLSGWEASTDGKWIKITYVMKNFVAAVELIQKIAEVAEAEDHHPDVHLAGYRNLTVELSTHAIGGLSENDFILAAKIQRLPKDLK